jgi:hypothetical protein
MAAGCGQPGGRILREHLTADYATHSFASNPARYASLFDDLPRDLAGISLVTQGLIYHYAADQYVYGYQPPPERLGEIDSRLIETILARILEKDDRPQCEPRAYEDHLLGCCRDFALLACSVLRHRGTPARVRCGFADYILPENWIDHVIGETWDGSRWRRFDPEMPASKPLAFAVLDQPEKRFATGGRAWQMIRHEDADPTRFGLGPEVPEPKGAWFIRNRLGLSALLGEGLPGKEEAPAHVGEVAGAGGGALAALGAVGASRDAAGGHAEGKGVQQLLLPATEHPPEGRSFRKLAQVGDHPPLRPPVQTCRRRRGLALPAVAVFLEPPPPAPGRILPQDGREIRRVRRQQGLATAQNQTPRAASRISAPPGRAPRVSRRHAPRR